jgi:hypothetical protein
MKALVCLSCSTIRSPKVDGSWTHCDCGQSGIRWVDPQKGVAEMWAVDAFYVRLLGLNNQVLTMPIVPKVGLPDEQWRRLHKLSCEQSEGYLFHTDRRDCWAVVTWPGESSDVTFREEPRMADSPHCAAKPEVVRALREDT